MTMAGILDELMPVSGDEWNYRRAGSQCRRTRQPRRSAFAFPHWADGKRGGRKGHFVMPFDFIWVKLQADRGLPEELDLNSIQLEVTRPSSLLRSAIASWTTRTSIFDAPDWAPLLAPGGEPELPAADFQRDFHLAELGRRCRWDEVRVCTLSWKVVLDNSGRRGRRWRGCGLPGPWRARF